MTIYGLFFNIIYTFLGSIFEPCYIQKHVITNRVIRRLWCSKKRDFKILSDALWFDTSEELHKRIHVLMTRGYSLCVAVWEVNTIPQ